MNAISATLETNPSHPVEQTSAKNLPIHRMGMWWFLGSEIAIFGGLVVTYLLYRLRHPEWATEAALTLTWVGSVNTVVLLTSSLLMILAHHVAMGSGARGLSVQERGKKAATYVGGAILLGLVFLGFKGYEYLHEVHAGYLPSRSLFWAFYFLMTGLHGLHIIVGLIANFAVWVGLKKGRDLQRVESAGIYWHFVDLVWIYLFPLLYLGSKG